MFLPFMNLPCLRPATPTPHHSTATAFRQYLISHSATSTKRVIHLPEAYRLTATPQGGDCFFHALSWSLPHTPQPQSLRSSLSTHIRNEASFYAAALLARGVMATIESARVAVAEFCDQVLENGVHGHWLGAKWGELEILAVARAFGVSIELFTFDVSKQKIRLYFHVPEGKRLVRMLFTGRADAGHFDALLPVRRFPTNRINNLTSWRRGKSGDKPVGNAP